jgi:hypothetical protein
MQRVDDLMILDRTRIRTHCCRLLENGLDSVDVNNIDLDAQLRNTTRQDLLAGRPEGN